MAASTYPDISKEVEIHIFRYNCIFRNAFMYKQPILTKWWNDNTFVQILYNCLRYTDGLLHVFFLLFAVMLSELHEEPRQKD